MWFAGRETWMAGGNRSEHGVGAALDHAQQRHLNELHSTKLALEPLRQQDGQRRQVAQNWPRPPANPFDVPAAAAAGQPSVAIYTGDDRACPISHGLPAWR